KYNINMLPQDLTGWMQQRFLQPIVNIEGGWEYWFQIDFPAWLDFYYKRQFDFRREVIGILPNGGRLDWLVNSQGSDRILSAFELKAQTHKYQNDKFVDDVLSDVAKLNKLDQTYLKVTLAAVIDDNSENALIQKNFAIIAKYPHENPLVKILFFSSL